MKKIIFLAIVSLSLVLKSWAFGSLAAVLEPLHMPIVLEDKAPEAPFKPLLIADPIFTETEEVVPPALPEVVIDHDALAVALEPILAEYYGMTHALKIHVLSGWDILYLNTEEWRIQIQEAPKMLAGRMFLTLAVKTPTTLLSPFRIAVACECWQEALFPKERLSHAKNLSTGDFEIRLINSLAYSQTIVPVSTDLDAFQLQSAIAINKPLFWSDIERRPDIPKGKKVNAILQDGALKITLKCEVLTPGRIGEFVSLRNLQSRKEFQGKVLDPDTVAVYYGS